MFKTVPWISLVRSAFLSILAWAFLSAFLHWGFQSVSALGAVLSLLQSNPVNLLTYIGVGFFIGALALFLLEKSESVQNGASLWFLVLFSAVGVCVYDFFPIRLYRLLGVTFSQWMLIGIVLGIFLCGNKHWR